ncbi:MAG: cytochrome c biogenesis protein CcdA [SAR202 cluster bacterium]|nr:cytochrome c biogenesis protein CcdA [SAR202 cluster bacterium]|tara:strand:+ start:2442 stop:3329 length:888 start_codon:yes stop_codon:yes gene_type:complete
MTEETQKQYKRIIFPTAFGLLVLGVTFIGALLTANHIGGVVGRVEALSASSANFLTYLTTFFPVGFAFGAGMVAAVNPCGFAMLPAYLGLYLGQNETRQESSKSGIFRDALIIGSTVTVGFSTLFVIVGFLISIGLRSLANLFPWIGLLMGILFIIVGAWLITNQSFYTSIPERIAMRLGNAQKVSVRGYFIFGISYGLSSLSCTLPIFLAVIGNSIAGETLITSLVQIVIYAMGMGSVIIALTLSMAFVKRAIRSGLQQGLPYINRAAALLLTTSGAFITYFWLTSGMFSIFPR